MQLGSVLRLFAFKALWESTRAAYFGCRIASHLASSDPNVRTIAGILLARGGPKAEPVLLEALEKRQNPEMVLRVLGDVAGLQTKPLILPYIHDSDPKIADAAKDALKVIDARLQFNPESDLRSPRASHPA